MVAAPEYGTMTFQGVNSTLTYSKDFYFSDVANASINFDDGAGASATSREFWVPPEPVLLRDVAIVTGGTDTKKLQLTKDGVVSGNMLRHTLHLNTLAHRPPLRIPFPKGAQISAKQIA